MIQRMNLLIDKNGFVAVGNNQVDSTERIGQFGRLNDFIRIANEYLFKLVLNPFLKRFWHIYITTHKQSNEIHDHKSTGSGTKLLPSSNSSYSEFLSLNITISNTIQFQKRNIMKRIVANMHRTQFWTFYTRQTQQNTTDDTDSCFGCVLNRIISSPQRLISNDKTCKLGHLYCKRKESISNTKNA